MAFVEQKSMQCAQKVQQPRLKLRVILSPSSVFSTVWVMAPPQQTRSHMPQLMHLVGSKAMRPR